MPDPAQKHELLKKKKRVKVMVQLFVRNCHFYFAGVKAISYYIKGSGRNIFY